MRIISGRHKGWILHPPKNLPVRPTMDKTKEALFNILENRISWDECNMLELFAGTGNISLEAGSRGALSITAVDQHIGCVKYIREISKTLALDQILPIKSDVLKWIKTPPAKPYDLIFLDPPYAMPGQLEMVTQLLQAQWLAPEGWLVWEHVSQSNYADLPGFVEKRVYGTTAFSFYHGISEKS